MRRFLGALGLVVGIVALAQPAWAIKVKMPDVRVDMTYVGSHDEAFRNQVFVTVQGLARPKPENLVLYPAGFRGKAVHPTLVRSHRWDDGPVALAIVYQGTSQEMVGTIASAFTAFKHGRGYADGSQVTVVEYTDRVDVRLPWSDISVLGPDVFEVTPGAQTSARADAISLATAELRRSRLPRHVLVILGDGCDLTGYTTPIDEPPEIMNFVFGSTTACDQINPQLAWLYPVRTPEHIRFALADAIAPSWYARFDVSSLDVIETGDRDLVLNVDRFETEPVTVSFPAPKVEPAWWDSRLRQLGLGALLVGMIALLVRSTAGRRSREAVT
ncbi:MAG: hypothetical protein HOV81_30695 [Kofleriaceae bacterium]|nr:hypothetical protein [Kofleriaceae bacterium]